MKRTLLIGMLLASVSAFALMGDHGQRQVMFEELELTPAQKKEMKIIRNETRDERIILKDRMESLLENKYERMMAVLNDEQQVKFKAMRKEMMQKRQKSCADHAKMGKRNPYDGE